MPPKLPPPPPRPRLPSSGEDQDIRALLQKYVGAKTSDPPPQDTGDVEVKLIKSFVSKLESFERTRQNLASQLGATISDSGTFTQLGQEQLDNMMLRAEVTKLQKESAELKDLIKIWTNRKNDWVIRIIFTTVVALIAAVWSYVTLKGGSR